MFGGGPSAPPPPPPPPTADNAAEIQAQAAATRAAARKRKGALAMVLAGETAPAPDLVQPRERPQPVRKQDISVLG